MGLDLLERKAKITTGLDWLQFLKRFFIHACSQSNSDGSVKTEPSELDWLQVVMIH